MPTVEFRGQTIDCPDGATLRDVLNEAGQSPHNGRATTINCRGHGSCGTCAVEIEGAVSEPTAREKTRLTVPPHSRTDGLRLACQVQVRDDLVVRKYPGFWGQHTDSQPADSPDE
jgi:ferredoxin